jgi:hypothetical protein
MSTGVQPGDKGLAYRQFYADFLNTYNRRFPFRRIAAKPVSKNWQRIGKADLEGCAYHLSFAEDGRFRVELTLQNRDCTFNKTVFDRLRENQEAIEAAFGEPLSWERRDNIKRSQIAAYYPGFALITDPEPMRAKYLAWAVERADRFRRVFDQQIEALDLG